MKQEIERFKYYTLFGVRISTDKNMKPTFSRDFVLRWTSNERKSCDLAKEMLKNELFKTTPKEAIEAVGLESESAQITGISARLRANQDITAHLFETDDVLTNNWLDILIEAANTSDYGKNQLAKAKIRM
jgi:hypothetical protein